MTPSMISDTSFAGLIPLGAVVLTNGQTAINNLKDFSDARPYVNHVGCYGSIYTTNGSTAQGSIGTSFVKVTGFAVNGVDGGITPDHTNDKLTVPVDGAYEITLSLSISGTANATFTFNVYIGGVASTLQMKHKMGTAGGEKAISVSDFLTVSAVDDIEVYVKAAAAGKSFTIVQAHLTARVLT